MERCSSSPRPLDQLLIVVREAPRLVTPALPTPHRIIHLPRIDNFSAKFGSVAASHDLLFFAAAAECEDDNPAQVTRHALEKVLVPYYPLAGRVRATEQGKVELVCNGKGAVFVEATANITLHELKKLDKTYCPELHYDVFPTDDGVADVPPLAVQVTRLACGGFVLSVRMVQSLCDSAGISQFLTGWSELARGKHRLSVLPLWRTEIPEAVHGRPRFHFPSLDVVHSQKTFPCRHERYDTHEFAPNMPIRISFEDLAALRKLITTEGTQKCTTMEALAAHVWRERTKALNILPTTEVRLFFLAHINYEVHDHIPIAFYGQWAFNCQAITTAGQLVQHPLSYAVRLIQAARASIEEQFASCATDFAELHCPCGCPPPGFLIFTVLSKDTIEIDFGWGKPPSESTDAVRLPSPVNVAAVTSVLSDSLHLTMNNIPVCSIEKLHFHIRDLPSVTEIEIESKL